MGAGAGPRQAQSDFALVLDAGLRVVEVAGDPRPVLGRAAGELGGVDLSATLPDGLPEPPSHGGAMRIGLPLRMRHAGGAVVTVEASLVELGGERRALLVRGAAPGGVEARLHEAFDELGVLAWSVDLVAGRVTHVNDAVVRLTGRSREELLAMPTLQGVVHPEDAPALARAMTSWEGSGVAAYEARVVRPDGAVRWVHAITHATHDAAGRNVGRESIAIDITAHRMAEEALRAVADELERRVAERTAELADLYDRAPCGYLSLGGDGNISGANETMLRWLGYTADEVLGRSFADLVGPSTADASQHNLARLRDDPTVFEWGGVERELVRSDGSTFWALLQGSIRRDARGRYLASRTTLVDITERRQADELLRAQGARLREALAEAQAANEGLTRANQAKDEFLAGMSHELRTPLNGVLGLTEALVEGVYGPLAERQRRTVALVHERGRHLLALINDVLDLAKVGAGMMDLELAPVHVAALVDDSIRLVQEAIQHKRLRLSVEQGGGAAEVLLDPRRVKQVLVNLLSNAVKFTPEGGSITVRVEDDPEDEVLRLLVRDDGVGIAAADAPRVFERFVQLDSRLARQHAGTGLGLSLVRGLVELHEGAIELDSAPGRGTCFTVALPLCLAGADMGPPPTPVPRARIVSLEGDGGRLHARLGQLGLEVRVEREAGRALRAARELGPALVLLDLQAVPDDGGSFLSALSADPDPSVAALPVLAHTALELPGQRARCLAAGAVDLVSRAVSLRGWARRIAALLANVAPS